MALAGFTAAIACAIVGSSMERPANVKISESDSRGSLAKFSNRTARNFDGFLAPAHFCASNEPYSSEMSGFGKNDVVVYGRYPFLLFRRTTEL